MSSTIEREARETYERLVAVRDEIDAGDKPWSALADFFTEDAVYIDPAWGRIEGLENPRVLREVDGRASRATAGRRPRTGSWSTGTRVVSPVGPGPRRAARRHALHGAGPLDPLLRRQRPFCYSHDMLNMTHIGQTMKEMGWKPPAEFNMPPHKPNRDMSLPKAWAHLEPNR